PPGDGVGDCAGDGMNSVATASCPCSPKSTVGGTGGASGMGGASGTVGSYCGYWVGGMPAPPSDGSKVGSCGGAAGGCAPASGGGCSCPSAKCDVNQSSKPWSSFLSVTAVGPFGHGGARAPGR